jgi:hypothetical protein
LPASFVATIVSPTKTGDGVKRPAEPSLPLLFARIRLPAHRHARVEHRVQMAITA